MMNKNAGSVNQSAFYIPARWADRKSMNNITHCSWSATLSLLQSNQCMVLVTVVGRNQCMVTMAFAGKSKGKAFDGMNGIAANMLLHLTSSVRFEGALNVDLNEITTNLVPFPRLHFLLASLSPLAAPKDVGKLMGPPRAVDQVLSSLSFQVFFHFIPYSLGCGARAYPPSSPWLSSSRCVILCARHESDAACPMALPD